MIIIEPQDSSIKSWFQEVDYLRGGIPDGPEIIPVIDNDRHNSSAITYLDIFLDDAV